MLAHNTRERNKNQLLGFKMTFLNIAEICPTTRTLGPGQRFAIWVQGCCFSCRNCISPDWVPVKEAMLVQPEKLANLILSTPGTQGITISGGEPMLQAEALLELLVLLKQQQDLSIICFTGFTLEQLRTKYDPSINGFLQIIDVLIDGQYIPELNDNQGWRGSSNQVVHFLSPRYQAEASLFLERKRNIEIHLRNDCALMVGIPPQTFEGMLEQTLHNVKLNFPT
jgi:anaerobic ribonucleoside-triphosphate reductase activating protein